MTKRRNNDGPVISAGIRDGYFVVPFRIFSDIQKKKNCSFCLLHVLPSARERPLSSYLRSQEGRVMLRRCKINILLYFWGSFFFSSLQFQFSTVPFTCCQNRYGMEHVNRHTHTQTRTDNCCISLYRELHSFLSYIFSKSIMLSARDGAWGRFTHICEYIIDFIEVHTCLL